MCLEGRRPYELSPDGRTIFYTIGLDDRSSADAVRHRDPTRVRVEERPVLSYRTFLSLAVSPDGLQLAMVLLGGIVEVMPAAGGQSREVFRPANPEQWTPARFVMRWRGLPINASCCGSEATTEASGKCRQPEASPRRWASRWRTSRISRCILTDGSSSSTPQLKNRPTKSGRWRISCLADREAAALEQLPHADLHPGQGGCRHDDPIDLLDIRHRRRRRIAGHRAEHCGDDDRGGAQDRRRRRRPGRRDQTLPGDRRDVREDGPCRGGHGARPDGGRLSEARQGRESQAAYERVVREFSDQRDAVSEARARLASAQLPAVSQSGPTARRIWAGKDKEFGPAVPSPDDRYSSFDGPTGDVVVRDLRTGVDRRVTDGADWFSEYTGQQEFLRMAGWSPMTGISTRRTRLNSESLRLPEPSRSVPGPFFEQR